MPHTMFYTCGEDKGSEFQSLPARKVQLSENSVYPNRLLGTFFETYLHISLCSKCFQKNYRGTQASMENKYALQSTCYCLLRLLINIGFNPRGLLQQHRWMVLSRTSNQKQLLKCLRIFYMDIVRVHIHPTFLKNVPYLVANVSWPISNKELLSIPSDKKYVSSNHYWKYQKNIILIYDFVPWVKHFR